MKVRRTKENMYAVIGLGRFGFALAQRLAESGAELIVVDKEESVINDATAFHRQRLSGKRADTGEPEQHRHPEL